VASLRELQRAFGRALVEPATVDATRFVAAAGIPAVRRVQVYRNNVLANLCGALEAVYPVVRRLVGEGFFGQVAKRYVGAVPSFSGDLHAYGASFPEFLAQSPELSELGYLPDVARLEWAFHQVFHAADAAPLSVAAITEVPADRWHALRFVLHPASALLHSPFPVVRIWQVNQEDWSGEATVSLDEGESDVLVRRQDGNVELMPLSPAELRLLTAFAHGGSLEQAVTAALEVDDGFDVGASLQKHLRLGTFAEYL